jgi:hypothetical protein
MKTKPKLLAAAILLPTSIALAGTEIYDYKEALPPPPVKSAILATDSTIVHYAKLHAVLTQGSPINVRIFKDRKEAAKWLKVPIDRLSAEAKGSSYIDRS